MRTRHAARRAMIAAAGVLFAAGCHEPEGEIAGDGTRGLSGKDGGSGNPPGEAGPTEKMGAGLELEFVEPESVEAGEPVAIALRVGGPPGASLRVDFRATEGVELSRREARIELDPEGRGRVELSVTAPRPRGCWLVAHVTVPDGRVQEAVCLLGGPEPGGAEKPGALEGRRLRIDPSR